MIVELRKDDDRFNIKKGERFKVITYPCCCEKVILQSRIGDGYNPMCTQYLCDVTIVSPSKDDIEKAEHRMTFLDECWSKYQWDKKLMPSEIAEKFRLLQKEQQEFESMYF